MGNNSQTVFFVKVGVVLAVIWGLVWGVMTMTGMFRETPEKVIAFIESHPLSEEKDSDKRRKIIGTLADKLNKLDHVQINEFGGDPERSRDQGEDFFRNMTPEEQLFLWKNALAKRLTR